MKRLFFMAIVVLGCCFHSAVCTSQKTTPAKPLSDDEKAVIGVCDGILELFENHAMNIWPGYDLNDQPFLIYLAPRWALFFNPPEIAPGFGNFPDGWPEWNRHVLFHEGRYKDLIGQLAFNYEIGGSKVIAIGFPEEMISGWENLEIRLFGDIVHEAFHQYQLGHFGEIPWAREERYPVLDQENSALAFIEMRILMDAVMASAAGESDKMNKMLTLFASVRKYRWRDKDSFVTRYEQGQEIREGSARYVEMKCLAEFNKLLKEDKVTGPASFLKEPFSGLSFPEYLINDFQDRMGENHVTPGNMLRNRIYPVGAALGFLADELGLDWKSAAQKAGPDFAFHRIFIDALSLDESALAAGLRSARELYDYSEVLEATRVSIAAYRKDYEKDLEAFEDQEGTRIDLAFSYRGLSRSRRSQGRRWVMDAGGISLCLKYIVYTLKSEGLLMEVRDAGILEEDDWEGKRKNVSFFVGGIDKIHLDGESLSTIREGAFNTLELQGEGLNLLLERPGHLLVDERSVHIILDVSP